MTLFYKPNIFITEMENNNELKKKYQYGWYGSCEEV